MADVTNFDDNSIQDVARFKRFKGKAGIKQRIFLVDRNVIKDHSHFQEGFGYFKCLAPAACPACASAGKSAKASVRIGTRILAYETDNDGNVKSPLTFDIQAFIFGPKTFSEIRNIKAEWGEELFKRDLVVSCNNEQFQHLSFTLSPISHFIKYAEELKAKNPEEAANVMKSIKEKIAAMDLNKVIAPVVDEVTMRKILTGEIVGRWTKNQKTGSPTSSSAGNFGGFETPKATASKDEVKSILESLAG